ncbi:hypothetical protein ABFT23_06825 [Nocardioides sp. C4-1]|uniref:hypothetical protein n=1 Tax=Nocardioides sp. C4-1 TaxID=3151851 RepID=UPI003262E190
MPTTTVPRARPAVVALALLVALLLLAAGGVLLRDLAVSQGWLDGRAWVPAVVDAVGDVRRSTGLAVAAAAVAVLGLLLLVAAAGRGRPTHAAVEAHTETWISPRAVAAVALEAADRAPGVLHAAVTGAGRRRVVLEVTGSSSASTRSVVDAAQEAASRAVASVPRVTVVVREAGGAR